MCIMLNVADQTCPSAQYKKLAKLDDEEAEELNLDANAIAMCSESPPLPTAEGSAGALLRITGAESVGTHSGSSAAGAAGNGKGLGQAWMSPRGKPGKLPPELHATMSDQLTEWCTANPGTLPLWISQETEMRTLLKKSPLSFARTIDSVPFNEGTVGAGHRGASSVHRVLVLGQKQEDPCWDFADLAVVTTASTSDTNLGEN
eukprot:SAG31_NODE_353_length_17229_cov_8.702160_13_plen_203_part_00